MIFAGGGRRSTAEEELPAVAGDKKCSGDNEMCVKNLFYIFI